MSCKDCSCKNVANQRDKNVEEYKCSGSRYSAGKCSSGCSCCSSQKPKGRPCCCRSCCACCGCCVGFYQEKTDAQSSRCDSCSAKTGEEEKKSGKCCASCEASREKNDEEKNTSASTGSCGKCS